MSGKKENVGARIEDAPNISREDLLDVLFSPVAANDANGAIKPPAGVVPRAEEWIDLADAGPYVDETTVPAFSPNGDGSGGEETYGDPEAAARWIASRLSGLPRVGGASDQTAAERTSADTE
jgi:hypothetical protein